MLQQNVILVPTMIVVIDHNFEVQCGDHLTDLKKCDPLALYATCAECGHCPLVNFAERLDEVRLDGVAPI